MNSNQKLEEILNSPQFAELFEMTPEEQELHDSLFNSPRAKSDQTLEESMDILGYAY